MNDEDNNVPEVADSLELGGMESLPIVESAIRSRTQKLSDLKEKIRNLNEMVNSYLENSEEYREAAKLAKDAAAKKSSIKKDLMSQKGADNLPDKLQEVRETKKELEESLSYYLAQFQQLSGVSEFEDENGELRQIIFSAKLVKRNVFEK